MRFTFLLPSDNLTGGNRVVAIYARQLMALGHEVLVVNCAQDRVGPRQFVRYLRRKDWHGLRSAMFPEPGHIEISGVPQKVMPRPGPITPTDVPDADYVVATWWETAVWMHGFPASKGKKIHLIQGYEVWLDPAIGQQVHAALRLPNQKIAISEDLRQTLLSQVDGIDVTVVPNAVDLAQFNAPQRSKNARPVVGYVYAVAAIKGADICGRACEIARQSIPDLEVLAFGADHPGAAVPLPTGAEFHFRPQQHELKHLYARCDLWLFGSRLDSFGLPILEAMACRTPVVAVPIGAAPVLLANGAGRLVDKESPEKMAAAMVELIQQPDADWQSMSAVALQQARQYSWDESTRKFLHALSMTP